MPVSYHSKEFLYPKDFKGLFVFRLYVSLPAPKKRSANLRKPKIVRFSKKIYDLEFGKKDEHNLSVSYATHIYADIN